MPKRIKSYLVIDMATYYCSPSVEQYKIISAIHILYLFTDI